MNLQLYVHFSINIAIIFCYGLCTDNFHAKHLFTQRTYLTGTVRPNRKQFPKELTDVVLEKGTAAYYSSHQMLATKCRSPKDTYQRKAKVL